MRYSHVVKKYSLAALVLGLSLDSSCSRYHDHLADYNFPGRTLATAFVVSPSPVLKSGLYGVRADDDVRTTVARAGAGVAKEVSARRAAAKLDSAVLKMDMAALISKRTSERAGRYLGLHPVTNENEADFVLEVEMKSFGINAESSAGVFLFANSSVVLLERKNGREIWRSVVHDTDRLTPIVVGGRGIPGDIVSATTLSQLSVAEFQRALDQLITLSASSIAEHLRSDLREARKDK